MINLILTMITEWKPTICYKGPFLSKIAQKIEVFWEIL